MYESPITLISKELEIKLEDGVYKAVSQTGVVVDKDELIKALKYDRGQYEKGYADAKAEQKKGENTMNEWEVVSKAFGVMADYCELMGLEYDNKFRADGDEVAEDRSFYNGARVACMNIANIFREFGKIIKG